MFDIRFEIQLRSSFAGALVVELNVLVFVFFIRTTGHGCTRVLIQQSADGVGDRRTPFHFLAQINRSDGDWVELPPAFTAQLGLQGPAVYIVWICGDREFAALFAPRAVSPCSVADGGACRRGLRRPILPGVWLRGDRERLAGPVAAVVLLRLGWRARMGAGGTPRRVVQFLIVVVHFS